MQDEIVNESNDTNDVLDIIKSELTKENPTEGFDDYTSGEQDYFDFSDEQKQEFIDSLPKEPIEQDDDEEEEIDFTSILNKVLENENPDEILDDILDDYELPVLAPELLELGNEALLKRSQEYEKGIHKLVERLKTKEQEFNNRDESINTLLEWNSVLNSPDKNTVQSGLEALVFGLCQQHQIDPYDIILNIQQNTMGNYSTSDVTDISDIDRIVEQKVQQRLSEYKEDLDFIKFEKQKKETSSKMEKYLDEISDKTINQIKKTESNWTVTRDMIREALTHFPDMMNNPVKATKMYFSDNRIEHYRKLNRKTDAAPVLTSARQTSGYQLPSDPNKLSALDILKAMSNQ